jgi:hypothetical protein
MSPEILSCCRRGCLALWFAGHVVVLNHQTVAVQRRNGVGRHEPPTAGAETIGRVRIGWF